MFIIFVQNSTNDKSDRIDYNEFLSCLMRIATRCYPSSNSYEDAMQQLFMDNILPLASRRVTVDFSNILNQESISALYTYYCDALKQLFRYYATASDQQSKVKNMMKSISVGNTAKSFDAQKSEIVEVKERNLLQNSQVNQVGYTDFLRFSSDMGLLSSMGLTCLDLGGDIIAV